MDAGGLAEQKGLKVGDQIVAVNGTSFENITHSNAVDILRSNATLIVTVKVRFAAFSEQVLCNFVSIIPRCTSH